MFKPSPKVPMEGVCQKLLNPSKECVKGFKYIKEGVF